MKSVTVIFHGQRWEKWSYDFHQLEHKLGPGFLTEQRVTSAPGDAILFARDAISTGADYLIAAGGDGTFNEVINGYLRADGGNAKTICGLWPTGSGNDFARFLGVNSNTAQLTAAILKGESRNIDAGELTYRDGEGSEKKRFFINITDIGIGGEVVSRVNRSKKRFGAAFAYRASIFRSFLAFRPAVVRLTADDFLWEGQSLSLCMANGRYFGNGLCIAPQADITDGMMDIVILGKISLWDYIRNLPRIKRGEVIEHPHITYRRSSSCRIEPIGANLPVDMDGEFIGYAPVVATMLPGAVRFLK